ncbi:uncharacterized protein LOC144437350 [Glandiceps talaboti]
MAREIAYCQLYAQKFKKEEKKKGEVRFKIENCEKLLWKIEADVNETYYNAIRQLPDDKRKKLKTYGLVETDDEKFIIGGTLDIIEICHKKLSEFVTDKAKTGQEKKSALLKKIKKPKGAGCAAKFPSLSLEGTRVPIVARAQSPSGPQLLLTHFTAETVPWLYSLYDVKDQVIESIKEMVRVNPRGVNDTILSLNAESFENISEVQTVLLTLKLKNYSETSDEAEQAAGGGANQTPQPRTGDSVKKKAKEPEKENSSGKGIKKRGCGKKKDQNNIPQPNRHDGGKRQSSGKASGKSNKTLSISKQHDSKDMIDNKGNDPATRFVTDENHSTRSSDSKTPTKDTCTTTENKSKGDGKTSKRTEDASLKETISDTSKDDSPISEKDEPRVEFSLPNAKSETKPQEDIKHTTRTPVTTEMCDEDEEKSRPSEVSKTPAISHTTPGGKEGVTTSKNNGGDEDSDRSVATGDLDSLFQCIANAHFECKTKEGIEIQIYKGDITKEKAKVIVNAANGKLQHYGGVALAIVRAGGASIQEKSFQLIAESGELTVGEFCSTSAGKLPSEYVIHAVGPRWDRSRSIDLKAMRTLHRMLVKVFDHANTELKVKSLATPAISSGLYGMPLEVSANVFHNAVSEFSAKRGAHAMPTLKSIRIVLFDQQATQDFILQFGGAVSSGQYPDYLPTSNVCGKPDTGHRTDPVNPSTSTKSGGASSEGAATAALTSSPPRVSTTDKIAVSLDKKGDCDICTEDGVFLKSMTCCKNTICEICFERHFASEAKCPFCTAVILKKKGNQPPGEMHYEIDTKQHLPGYDKKGTITIVYHFPNGTQKENHPNPGKPYRGTDRVAYLPANEEGRAVLTLLQQAFEERVVFTIGKSVTTGRDNCVVWNDIHHKTNIHGGAGGYGYPDDTYLSRVKEELAAKGIK